MKLIKKLSLLFIPFLIAGCNNNGNVDPGTTSSTSGPTSTSTIPGPVEYNISYYGMDSSMNVVPLYGIDIASLVYKANEGSTVTVTPAAKTGYEFVRGFGYSQNVHGVSDDNGTISFTMPSGNAEFILVVNESSVVTLSSISVSGQVTDFTVGDTFSFGGTVTAHYSDSTVATVTNNATFSGYNMSEAGDQTVTVSYTEGGVTKTTTYGITVSENEPVPATYAEAFEELKTKITTRHNYTMTVHSYLQGYEEDPDNVWDDEVIMINNKIICWDDEYKLGKTGYIYQKNQGYVYFDYYGSNVLTDGFYSTRLDAGITDIFDLVAENLFIGSYAQDPSVDSKFITNNVDVIAVAANFSGFPVTSLVSPLSVYFSVSADKRTMTLHSEFMMYWYDEGEQSAPVISTLYIHDIGTTSNTAFENYIENPTDSYVAPTAWTSAQNTLFSELYAGVSPTFVSGLSYSARVSRYNDTGIYKALLVDFASGDLTESYANVLINNELFEEIPSERSSRLFRRIDIDSEAMTQTTYTVEISFASPSSTLDGQLVSRLYPNGAFNILFKGTITNMSISTVQLFNEYLTTKGYNSFVPLFNMSSSISITKFTDETDKKNLELGYHAYEFYSSTFRVYISDFDAAKAAISGYVALFGTYGFTSVSKSAFTKQAIYSNVTRFKTDSSITIMDLEDYYTSSDYPGFFEIRYLVYAEKDPSDLPVLKKIVLSDYKTDFTVGDSFSYGGKVEAQYSTGDSHYVDLSDCTFDQYDLSQSGDQTVRVTYTENEVTVYAYYDIHVESTVNYFDEFDYAGHKTTVINLCDDGTGTYNLTYGGKTYTQYFTYVISGSTITFTLTKNYKTSDFTRHSLFAGESINTTRVGTYDSVQDMITVDISTSTGTNSRTLNLQRV